MHNLFFIWMASLRAEGNRHYFPGRQYLLLSIFLHFVISACGKSVDSESPHGGFAPKPICTLELRLNQAVRVRNLDWDGPDAPDGLTIKIEYKKKKGGFGQLVHTWLASRAKPTSYRPDVYELEGSSGDSLVYLSTEKSISLHFESYGMYSYKISVSSGDGFYSTSSEILVKGKCHPESNTTEFNF